MHGGDGNPGLAPRQLAGEEHLRELRLRVRLEGPEAVLELYVVPRDLGPEMGG